MENDCISQGVMSAEHESVELGTPSCMRRALLSQHQGSEAAYNLLRTRPKISNLGVDWRLAASLVSVFYSIFQFSLLIPIYHLRHEDFWVMQDRGWRLHLIGWRLFCIEYRIEWSKGRNCLFSTYVEANPIILMLIQNFAIEAS